MHPTDRSMAIKTAYSSIGVTFRAGSYIASLVLGAVDYGAAVLAIITAWYLRASLFPEFFPSLTPFTISNKYVYFVVPFTYLLFLAYEGLYMKRPPFWKNAELIFRICTYVSALTIITMYFTFKDETISRIFIVLMWILSFVYLVVARYVTKRILLYSGLWEKPIVIVGAGKTAEILAKSFAEEPALGYKIVGLIEDNYSERPLIHRYPHIGTFAGVEAAIIDSGVQDVIIAVPGLERKSLVDLIYRIQPYVRDLTIVPDLFGVPLSNMQVDTLYKEKTIILNIKNNLASLRNRAIKRLFDIVVGSLMLILLLPALCIISLIIRMDSHGPALYVAKRLGCDGKEFFCYKFRTMRVDADGILAKYFEDNPQAKDEWEKYAKLKTYDPRVTDIGQWLRKYSLDELPQVINVLTGDMSLVGPRPYLPREKVRMGYVANTILGTVPGITGLWQVSGRNEIEFDGRLQIDSWYVRNWSFWQDIVILLKTVKVVIGRKGAY